MTTIYNDFLCRFMTCLHFS